MKRIKVGDVFELVTPKGYSYLQYVSKKEYHWEMIRVLGGLYKERPNSLEKIVASRERFFLLWPISYIYKDKVVDFIGNYPIPKETELPEFMRRRGENGKGWEIVNIHTLRFRAVDELAEEEVQLSPQGIWGYEIVKEKISSGWKLEDWV